MTTTDNETHVVIVGAGFGGNGVLHGLLQQSSGGTLPTGMKVTVIDRKETMTIGATYQYLWSGRLSSSTTPTSWPLRSLVAVKDHQEQVTLLCGSMDGVITSINHNDSKLQMENGAEIIYDILVLSPGVISDSTSIPGLTTSSLAIDICNVVQIPQMKQQLETIVQNANTTTSTLPTIMILVTKTPYKCPPVPFEYASLVDDYMRQHEVRDKVKIILAVPGGFPFAGPPAAKLFTSLLDEMDIEFWTHHSVTSISEEGEGETKKKVTTVHFQVGEDKSSTKDVVVDGLFCTFPQRAPNFCNSLVNPGGFIPADLQTNQVVIAGGNDDEEPSSTLLSNVFAIGDACHVMFPKPKKPHPKAGEFAYLMGVHVADHIKAIHTGTDPPPPPIRKALCVAECGVDGQGVNIGPNFTDILATPKEGMPKFLLDKVDRASQRKSVWINGYLTKMFGGAVEAFPEDFSSE